MKAKNRLSTTMICLAIGWLLGLFQPAARAEEQPLVGIYSADRNTIPMKNGHFGPSVTPKMAAQFDYLIGKSIHQLGATFMAKLFQENPDLKFLQNLPSVFIDSSMYPFLQNDPELKKHLVLDVNGNIVSYWDNRVVIINITKPETVTWYVNKLMTAINADKLRRFYDGYFLDGVHYVIYDWFKGNLNAQIDADRDGQPDSKEELDTAWSNGTIQLLNQLRARLPQNSKLVANDAATYGFKMADHLDGVTFENQLTDWLEGRTQNVLGTLHDAYRWNQHGNCSLLMMAFQTKFTRSSLLNNWFAPWLSPEAWNKLYTQGLNDFARHETAVAAGSLAETPVTVDWCPYAPGHRYKVQAAFTDHGRQKHYLGQAIGPVDFIFFGNSQNLIGNNNFENSQPWESAIVPQLTFRTLGVDQENGNHFMKVSVNGALLDPWMAKVFHRLPLDNINSADPFFTSFRMRASNNRSVFFEVYAWNESRKDYKRIIDYTKVNLTTTWQDHHFSFEALQKFQRDPGTTLDFAFYVAGDEAEIQFDEIVLKQGSVIVKRDFENGKVLLNPYMTKKMPITFEKSLYNLEGQVIKSLNMSPRKGRVLLNK